MRIADVLANVILYLTRGNVNDKVDVMLILLLLMMMMMMMMMTMPCMATYRAAKGR